MSENNPYQAPHSNLDIPQNTTTYNINPDWQIEDVMREAWDLSKGFKLSYWGAMIIYIIIAGILSTVFKKIEEGSVSLIIISQIIQVLITYPLLTGLTMLAVKRSINLPVNAAMIFDYYPKTISIFLMYLLMSLLIVIGCFLLVIPGIYLAVAYCMAINLLVNKNMGIWEALETSRQAITQCWFRTFAFYIVLIMIIIIGALPILIGLIWALPFATLCMAIVYRNLFGVSPHN